MKKGKKQPTWKVGGLLRVQRHTVTKKDRTVGKRGYQLIQFMKDKLGDFDRFQVGLTSPWERCFVTLRECLCETMAPIICHWAFDFHENGKNPGDAIRAEVRREAKRRGILENEAFFFVPAGRRIQRRLARRMLLQAQRFIAACPEANVLLTTHTGPIEMMRPEIEGRGEWTPYIREMESVDFQILYRGNNIKLKFLRVNRRK